MSGTFDINRSASTPATESSSLTHSLQVRMDDRNVVTFSPEKKTIYFSTYSTRSVADQSHI